MERAARREHHGEFKVAGGKLVVADLDVVGGRFSSVSINGDFFLEPDEALDDINAALEGLPIGTPHGELATAVRQRLRPDAELFGFSPEAVATAVRRAIGVASSWADHQWEIIGPTPLPTAMHVAMDEVLTREVGRSAEPNAALLGVGEPFGGHRQLPVHAQRGGQRCGQASRRQRGAPHQRWRSYVHGARKRHHLLPVRSTVPG